MSKLIKGALNASINELKQKNVLFCSEADFQFSLAWKMQEILGKEAEIILEYSHQAKNKKIKYIDLYIKFENEISFIELKYKTKQSVINRYGNNIPLKDQLAYYLGRKYFVMDIERLEELAREY